MGKYKTPSWLGYVAAGLMAVALFGCGGDDGATGPQGPAGPTGPAGPAGPTGPAAKASPIRQQHSDGTYGRRRQARSGRPPSSEVTVTSVTIASPPVVEFTVTDEPGSRWSGLGNHVQEQHRHGRQLSQPGVLDRQARARAPTAARASGSATSSRRCRRPTTGRRPDPPQHRQHRQAGSDNGKTAATSTPSIATSRRSRPRSTR